MGQQLMSNANILMQRELQTFEPSAHKCLALPDSLCRQKGSPQRDRQATGPWMLRIKTLGQQDTETELFWGNYALYTICSLAGFVKICRCARKLNLGTFCTVGSLASPECFSGTGEQKDTSGPQTGTDIWYSLVVDAWKKILFDSKIKLQSSNITPWVYLTAILQRTLILKEYTYANLVKISSTLSHFILFF